MSSNNIKFIIVSCFNTGTKVVNLWHRNCAIGVIFGPVGTGCHFDSGPGEWEVENGIA